MNRVQEVRRGRSRPRLAHRS